MSFSESETDWLDISSFDWSESPLLFSAKHFCITQFIFYTLNGHINIERAKWCEIVSRANIQWNLSERSNIEMIWGGDYKDFVHVMQNVDTSTNSPSLSKGCFSTRKTEMFQTFHKYNENNTIKHQTFRFKQCRIVLLRPLKCREEKTPSPTYDYSMGDKIGKKDRPTFWAKRMGFSHSDYISAGFELLDFEPKSKDNSWSYVQIFHSVYTKERKKSWVAVGA